MPIIEVKRGMSGCGPDVRRRGPAAGSCNRHFCNRRMESVRLRVSSWMRRGTVLARRLAGAAGVLLLAMVMAAGAAQAADAAGEGPPPPEPQDYRMDDFRSPVPLTLKGAKVLTGDQAADLWNDNAAIFVDVYPQAPKPPNLPAGTYWREPTHRSIEGAHWLPNIGYGVLSDEHEAYFTKGLEHLTKGDRNAPLVFFCLKNCWMSWNAAKRALAAGYTNVMWLRDGTDAWEELGYPLVDLHKEP